MDIREEHEQGVIIVALSGKLDAENAVVLNDWLYQRVDAGQTRFVLNFGGVSYLSSAGLRTVLSLRRTLEKKGGDMAICGLYGPARQVFQVAGLLKVMRIAADVPESIALIGGGAE